MAALSVIVVVWDFGATLIWGTGGPTKLRFAYAFSTIGGSALLACAALGIIAAAAALRSFAHANKRTGTVLSAIFALAFAVWSSAVRYPPVMAAVGLLAGLLALRWAATMSLEDQPAHLAAPLAAPLARGRLLRAFTRVGLPFLFGALYYACLRWGPKSSVDAQCGASLAIPAFIVSVGIPALAAGFSSRAAGRRTEAVAAAAVITTLLAAAICVVVFLIWFGQNNCGE